MYQFWEPVIAPLLEVIRPSRMIEIGADLGYTTRLLAGWCATNEAVLHVVDPTPKFEGEPWLDEAAEAVVLHRSLSLDTLPGIGPVDAVFIDGDHNWFTVLNELQQIERNARDDDRDFPVVVLHDVGWPYGRRDLYYDPETIPSIYRQPYRHRGIEPFEPELVDSGGLNLHLANAIHEGTPRNGVLTAVEDFLESSEVNLACVRVEGFHGLCILAPEASIDQSSDLRMLLGQIEGSPPLRRLMVQLERERLELMIAIRERRAELEEAVAALKQHRGEASESAARVADLQRRLHEAQAQLQERREQLISQREAYHGIMAQLRKLGRDTSAFAQQRHEAKEEARDLRSRLRQTQRELAACRDARTEAQRTLASTQARLNRLASRRSVRVALRAAQVARPAFRLVRRSSGDVTNEAQAPPPAGPAQPLAAAADGTQEPRELTRAAAARPRKREPNTTQDLLRTATRCEVVVCVHDALDEVRACLASIATNTNKVEDHVILVDDGSGPETAAFLRATAAARQWTLLRNEEAKGYGAAADMGIAASRGRFVVLLNSDTVVSTGWLDRLVTAAESDPSVGIVGPLSNAASWQSIPDLTDPDGDWALNPLPEGVSVDELAQTVAIHSPRLYPEIELVNGFCYLITREALDRVGSIDVERFARGYGEEDDFSLRCRAAGLTLRIADDCYVFHHKSKSFTPAGRKEIVKRSKELLREKHGDLVSDSVRSIKSNEALLRARTYASFSPTMTEPREEPDFSKEQSLRLAWVQPHLGEVGGIRRTIEMTNRLAKWGFDVDLVTPAGEPPSWLPFLGQLRTVGDARDQPYDVVIASDPDILTPFRQLSSSVKVIYHLAAYMRYRQDDPGLVGFYEADDQTAHIANSRWTAEMVESYAGVSIAGIFPGGVDKRQFRPVRAPVLHDVVCYGSKRPHKGTADIAEAAHGLQMLRIQDVGATQRELAALISSGRVFASGCWHEGFNFCPLEAMSCGVPVVMTDDGGSREYAVHEENALIVPPRDTGALRAAIDRAIRDQELRMRLIDNGLRTAYRYDWDQVSAELGSFLVDLWERKGAKP